LTASCGIEGSKVIPYLPLVIPRTPTRDIEY
jgi:hypothetical protein